MDPGEPMPSVMSEVTAQLEAAVEEERRGASKFRELARNEEDRRNGFLALLLELMAMDGDKHERMLRFALGEIRTGIRPARPPTSEEGRKE
jgi:hypothetical protein